jgi:hypothetical protein
MSRAGFTGQMRTDERDDERTEFAPVTESGPEAAVTIPGEHGTRATPDVPDPAPEANELPPVDERDRGGTGAPVGSDNIREGRVGGVMGPARQQGGQGQGG